MEPSCNDMQQFWEKKAKNIHSNYYAIGTTMSDDQVRLNYRYKMQIAHLFRLVKFDQSMSVLDLGCNIGSYAIDFAKKCKSVVAIDFSPTFIKYANKFASDKGISNVTFLCQDITDYSYLENRNFDIIHIGGCLMYMDDDSVSDLLKQLRHHLNKDGLLITRDSVALKQRRYGDSSNPCVFRTDDEYSKLLQTSGFKLIYNNYSMFPSLLYNLYDKLPSLLQKNSLSRGLLSLSLSILAKMNFILLRQRWFIRLFIDPWRRAGYYNRYYFLQ